MSSLFMHSVSRDYVPKNDRILIESLLEIELLGAAWPIPVGEGFIPGEKFFQLITFMGCAPSFKLEPDGPADEQFCHIRIATFPSPQFFFLRPERPARCPQCRKPGITASEFQQQHVALADTWHCPSCQQQLAPDKLDWRKEAGLARCIVEVRDVYPHEGVPTDHLLLQLREMTDQQWSWFYA